MQKLSEKLSQRLMFEAQDAFGQRTKRSLNDLGAMAKLQLDIVHFNHSGVRGKVRSFIAWQRLFEAGLATKEETPTHVLFTQRIGQCGAQTIGFAFKDLGDYVLPGMR